ncbi:agmatinase [Candidatus Sumerlaeota bacterium]|nr:agmatinase [Candidatus Sumerlaeota bacterium]
MTGCSLTPTSPFLDLPPESSDPASAMICVLPVPYDGTTSYQTGARFGPAALIAASHQVELFDESLGRETCRVGIHTCSPVRPNAAGPEAMIGDVRQRCEPLLEAGRFVAIIGGEHTVALGAIAAHIKRRSGRPFGVVQFDAHRDLRSSYDGTPWSHACVAARMLDWQLPVIQIGVRAWSGEENDKAAAGAVTTLTARELFEGNAADLLSRALKGFPEEVYLTFDLDALDPSIMPSTGTPEPGGLSWYQALVLLEQLIGARRIIGLDVVELAPIGGLVAPDLLAARLLYRMFGLIVRNSPLS